MASLGAAGLHLLSPLTTAISYGAFEPDGTLDVRFVYDHRLLDGAPAARAAMEDVLHGPIRDELLGLKTESEAAMTVSEFTPTVALTSAR